MRLAVVTDALSSRAGGMLPGIRDAARALYYAGVDVRVFGVTDSFAEQDLATWQPVPVTVTSPCWPPTLGISPRLAEKIVDAHPDVIELHGLWRFPSLALRIALRQLRRPYMVHPHGMLDPWAVRRSAWKKRLAEWAYERRNLREAACFRALNESEANALRAYGLVNPIAIIPYGVAVDALPGRVEPTSTTGGSARGAVELGRIFAGRRVLLYLGRLHPKKGLVNLVRGWGSVWGSARCANSLRDWSLVFAGWDEGGYATELSRECEALGLGGSVHFVGPLFGAARELAYASAAAVILPSFSEGLPMVILEAWARGKPVLMTEQCNVPEGFAANAAIKIEPNELSIAEGIAQLVRMSHADRELMGARGVELVRRRFALPVIAERLLEVYTWLLGGGPQPSCVVRGQGH